MAGSAPAKGRIFISYRREETAYPAAWLFDRLSDSFGTEQVFKDVDSMEPGDDFVAVITSAVESCDVLLALIGDRWLTVTDHDGKRRLDNPDDFVRLEIEAALTRGVRVIPILVEGARMPRADQLPPSLAKLVRRHALELSPSGFHFETSRLLRVLSRALTSATGAAATKAPGEGESAAPLAQGSPASGPEDEGESAVGSRAVSAERVLVEAAPPSAPVGGTSRSPEPPEADQVHAPAQWAPDPFRTHELRYWDGTTWTEHVADGNVVGTDPPGFDGRPGLITQPRHQPLPGADDAQWPLPAGAAAVYFPDGCAVPGVAVMPDRYETVGELLVDLYEGYLREQFAQRSYGRMWVVGGMSRCIVPMAWLSDVGRPVGDDDEEWHRLSPAEAGLRSNQTFRVLNPAEHRYCGVLVDEIDALRSLEVRDDVFFDRRTGRLALLKRPLFQQLAKDRSFYPPSLVSTFPAQYLGVFMCGISASPGRVLDLRGPAALHTIQNLADED